MGGFKRCRRAQLSVVRFNDAFSGIVFGFKIMCVAAAIIAFACSITFSTSRPILSVGNSFYGVQMVINFTTFYGDGFRIPQYVDEMRSILKGASGKNQDVAQRRHMNLLLKSIPQVRIKVGTFSYLERASTLIFTDFVSTQTVSLVIALKSN